MSFLTWKVQICKSKITLTYSNTSDLGKYLNFHAKKLECYNRFFFNFWQILDDFYPLCYSPDISIPVSYLSRHIFEGGPDRLRTILYLTRRLNCVEMNLFQSHMLCHWQGILIWCGKMCERNISHSIQKSRFNVSLDDFLEFYRKRTKILGINFDDGF